MKRPRSGVRQQGFTLLEMMVALAIAGAIAVMAYQGLTAASNGAERSRQIMDQINSLDRAWQLIGQDFRHIVVPKMGPTGLSNPFEGDPEGALANEERILRFTRHSWANPLERLRSDLQEVQYWLDEDRTLWRLYRPERNEPYDEYEFEEEAVKMRLLEDVKLLEMRFLSQAYVARSGKGALQGDDYTRDWSKAWPDPDQVGGDPAALPYAVLLRIEVEGVGVSERLFEIVNP
ncbi:type II secretion system minor pseudopilin GspJ [Marinimicrobium agarilyticum]|uniref:type II secretion system minor pseudopilin GspJ n=1 Tax=Marinimicrobium agarilyticum TaxID=306546 RepID=UPI000427ABB7|nr:type II secretion system minor pseudopilin GspJ [Marinimicrobium agarilyticum]